MMNTYPIADPALKSDLFQIRVACEALNAEVAAYRATVKNAYFYDHKRKFDLEEMAFCSFDADFDQPVTLSVQPNFTVQTAAVRGADVKWRFADNTVTVTLAGPAKFSVEFDGNIYNNLFVFADKTAPPQKIKGTLVFHKGVHDAGKITLTSNDCLVIESGAFVYGTIAAKGDNIRICGGGVLCGAKYSHDDTGPRDNLLLAAECRNLAICDIMLLDSPAWTCVLVACDSCQIMNVKQIGYARNSDGLDICASKNVYIEDVFLRNYDDNISVKASAFGYSGDCLNIVMRNSTLWADCAHNMLIGPESNKNECNVYAGIFFENIIVLQHKECLELYQGVMAIFGADNSVIRNIAWKNIDVERMDYGKLLSICYTEAYAETVGRDILDVRVENVRCKSETPYCSVILGEDAQHRVSNVQIRNVTAAGRRVDAESAAIRMNVYCENVVIDGIKKKI